MKANMKSTKERNMALDKRKKMIQRVVLRLKQKQEMCPKCYGLGENSYCKCEECRGRGWVWQQTDQETIR